MKKRFLSILVCLCMLSILLTSAVSAADKAKPYFYTKIRRTKRLAATWQGYKDSNLGHLVLETNALPTELHPYKT